MGSIVVRTLITLDGVVEHPHRWSAASRSPESTADARRELVQADALLLGRRTHRYLLGRRASAGDREVIGRMGRMPTHVVSSRATGVDGERSTLVRGDAVAGAGALREHTDRRYLVVGSPTLVLALLPAGLVDELVLVQCPVVVGTGAPLFPPGSPQLHLEPAAATALPGGRTLLRFHHIRTGPAVGAATAPPHPWSPPCD